MLSTAPIPSFSQVLPAQGCDTEQISGAVRGNAGGWWAGGVTAQESSQAVVNHPSL